jgi:hypothetical protein
MQANRGSACESYYRSVSFAEVLARDAAGTEPFSQAGIRSSRPTATLCIAGVSSAEGPYIPGIGTSFIRR